VKIAEKLMEISGPLFEVISISMKGYDLADQYTLFQSICEYINDQVMIATLTIQ
jgi:hypothetical protein